MYVQNEIFSETFYMFYQWNYKYSTWFWISFCFTCTVNFIDNFHDKSISVYTSGACDPQCILIHLNLAVQHERSMFFVNVVITIAGNCRNDCKTSGQPWKDEAFWTVCAYTLHAHASGHILVHPFSKLSCTPHNHGQGWN